MVKGILHKYFRTFFSQNYIDTRSIKAFGDVFVLKFYFHIWNYRGQCLVEKMMEYSSPLLPLSVFIFLQISPLQTLMVHRSQPLTNPLFTVSKCALPFFTRTCLCCNMFAVCVFLCLLFSSFCFLPLLLYPDIFYRKMNYINKAELKWTELKLTGHRTNLKCV